jgi:broad specificity polyphosphatase/5'/3'-nucleotidase SurE
MDGFLVQPDKDQDVDDVALAGNYVSVTPLHFNLTHNESLTNLASWKVFNNGNI